LSRDSSGEREPEPLYPAAAGLRRPSAGPGDHSLISFLCFLFKGSRPRFPLKLKSWEQKLADLLASPEIPANEPFARFLRAAHAENFLELSQEEHNQLWMAYAKEREQEVPPGP
jgi:hypothetical protein